jgi:hypothetical protein
VVLDQRPDELLAAGLRKQLHFAVVEGDGVLSGQLGDRRIEGCAAVTERR